MEHKPTINPYLAACNAYTEFNTELEHHKYLLETAELVKQVKQSHANIHFKFNPSIQDIRPFLWQNFIAIQRYTYVVDLLKLNELEVFQVSEFKKFKSENFKLEEQDANLQHIQLHLNFLKGRISTRRWKIIQRDLTQHLSELSVLNILDAQQNLQAQMIYNKHSKRAEQLFYWETKAFKKERGGVFAQYSFLLHFKSKNFVEFDFCGANIKSIAQFKSRFPVELKIIYEMWYHQNPIKRFVRKYLFHQI